MQRIEGIPFAGLSCGFQRGRANRYSVIVSIRENIRIQADKLKASTPLLADLVTSGKLKIVGGEYALKTGAVERVV